MSATEAGTAGQSLHPTTRLGLQPNIEAAIAYIPIISLIVVTTEHKDPYVDNKNSVFYAKFNGYQGLFAFLIYIPLFIIAAVIDAILGLGIGILSLIVWALYIIFIVVMAIIVYQKAAYPNLAQGDASYDQWLTKVPLIGKFAYTLTEDQIDRSAC